MQTIGDRLEEARKKKGISIREAAESTKIRGDYLTKFESNQFDIGLTEIYVRGFLRAYATFLKLPAEKIINDYASLGHETPKTRQPSREVYGRMDLSIASADERDDSSEPTPRAAAPQSQRASRSAPLSHGTALDPALVFKVAKIAGFVVGAAILVWIGLTVFGGKGGPDAPAKSTASTPAIQTAAEPTATFIASDAVEIKVVQKSDGAILYAGFLARGESRPVPKRGALLITASKGENLTVEVNGKRYPMPFSGHDRAELP
ncbi:MAG: helix-turn-helix domain-containing protein [Verrucomicrobia bacterium]|nr:helix-turn-helix domain-containing protein [Verrucomicrobiota bacterium]